ncbi:hypothetical protein BH11BAC7_BH11BAC7_04550 [soil metagenome]
MKKNPSSSRRSINPVADDQVTYVGMDCDDNNTNVFYVGVHAISKKKFDDMIVSYFKKPMSAIEIPIIIGDNDCDQHHIKWDTKDAFDDNSDLELGFANNSKSFTAIGKYSIHFFKGIEILFGTCTYEFSKANDPSTSKPTVVMRVMYGGNAVYHGDLTHMYP